MSEQFSDTTVKVFDDRTTVTTGSVKSCFRDLGGAIEQIAILHSIILKECAINDERERLKASLAEERLVYQRMIDEEIRLRAINAKILQALRDLTRFPMGCRYVEGSHRARKNGYDLLQQIDKGGGDGYEAPLSANIESMGPKRKGGEQ